MGAASSPTRTQGDWALVSPATDWQAGHASTSPSARGPGIPSERDHRRRFYKEGSRFRALGISASSLKANMSSAQQLQASADAFFEAFSASCPPVKMLSYFSTTQPVIIQHAPIECPHPHTSRLVGSNAIRSYFDILATHWKRSGAQLRHEPEIDTERRRVIVPASIDWVWKRSGKKWTEEFTWTLDFDESFKIESFVVRTVSGPSTCVMRAIDEDSSILVKPLTQAQL